MKTIHSKQMPQWAKISVSALVFVLIASAVYLMIVRGPVMLLDMAAGMAQLMCF